MELLMNSKNIENRIHGIKAALERMGKSLSEEEFSELLEDQEDSHYSSSSKDLENPSFPEPESQKLKQQLRHVSQKISEKDFIISRMMIEQEELLAENTILKDKLKHSAKKEADLLFEIQELKQLLSKWETEKNQLEDDLSSSQQNVERLKRSLKIKEDTIYSISHPKAENLSSLKDQLTEDPVQLTSPKTEGSFKVICLDAMKITGVSKTKDFYSRLHHLVVHHKKYKKSRKLIDRLSDMVVQCSPAGSFAKEPTIQEIWRWITALVDEYMKIKKSCTSEKLERLQELTGCDNYERMHEKILNAFKDY